jgi:DNA-binding NtrC family response regulator
MMLEAADVEIVGSAGSVGEAEEIAASITADIAILDVNLDYEMFFPAADVFVARGIPVIFTTGYTSAQGVPDRFVGTARATKPYKADVLIDLIKNAQKRYPGAMGKVTLIVLDADLRASSNGIWP